jgi:hypothetical protein
MSPRLLAGLLLAAFAAPAPAADLASGGTPVDLIVADSRPGPPAAPAGPPPVKRRLPFEADVTASAKPGENTIALRVDNRTITELFLGGILRPVLLVEKGPPALT